MPDHFGQADHGEIGGINHGLDAEGLQLGTRAAVEASGGIKLKQARNDWGGVHIARSLAGGNEKLHCVPSSVAAESVLYRMRQRSLLPGVPFGKRGGSRRRGGRNGRAALLESRRKR